MVLTNQPQTGNEGHEGHESYEGDEGDEVIALQAISMLAVLGFFEHPSALAVRGGVCCGP